MAGVSPSISAGSGPIKIELTPPGLVLRLQYGIERMREHGVSTMRCSAVAGLFLWGMLCGTAAATGNLADVTIHDRAENRDLPVYRHAGRYYVVGRPGHEYAIRVCNRSGTDVLAVVSVDGVNAVSGETAAWGQTGYVLARDQSFDIMGWRKSLQRVAAFFFTEHENSYAARTGRPDNVGVIGVAVFRGKTAPEARIERDSRLRPWRERSDAPEAAAGAGAGDVSGSAESSARDRVAPAPRENSASLGTGHGRRETSRVTYTDFERRTPYPEEVIEIHYDSYQNLVAQGVIRAPRTAMPAPFPGEFVPDPH